ncbi:hypothetical protein P4345_25695 [Cytobacillus horneckiae]|uniref:hypothetical protein n=1 Tax=Cytobacillus horneckiae TaxID=549687 RepID=UPI002E231E5F|nr:hypothetical protein [Cytobacillus horneckiae]
MSKELVIDINRTGFPVKVGSVELWFDSSFENLRRFFNVDELAQKKLKIAEEKAKHIHFPEDMNVENLDEQTIDAAFDVNKEFIAAQYDIIFGDDTFRKIYKEYPDILALDRALEVVGAAIAQRLEEQEESRSKEAKKKQNEYLNKKAKKK